MSDQANVDVARQIVALQAELLNVQSVPLQIPEQPPRTGTVLLLWLRITGWQHMATELTAWLSETPSRPGVMLWVPGAAAEIREAGLQAGCDDAISDAISSRELAVRIRALHRRLHWRGSPMRLRFGPLKLDLETRTLHYADQAIPLTPTEFALLRVLLRAQGKSLARSELIDAVWGEETDHETSGRAVDNVVLRLRRKLPTPEMIETVRGIGFRLVLHDDVVVPIPS